MAKRTTGVVRWYDGSKGYGYIDAEDGEDVFVHYSAITGEMLPLLLEGEQVGGASAEVTSALPLTGEEKEAVKQDVLSKIGDQATVTFRVDPAILGGLVIRVGDKILDGSVSGQLESMRQSLY